MKFLPLPFTLIGLRTGCLGNPSIPVAYGNEHHTLDYDRLSLHLSSPLQWMWRLNKMNKQKNIGSHGLNRILVDVHNCGINCPDGTAYGFADFIFLKIFSSAWLCQQSSWNRNLSVVCRPSVVRPSVSQLSLNSLHGFLSNFSCGFPWAIRSDFFWIFQKKFFLNLLRIFFDPMGAKISKRYSYNSQPKVLKLFLNFLPNGPHKTMFGIFEILKIEILMNFIRCR